MNDTGGKRFNAEAGDGREGQASHGLSSEIRGELSQGERVNALATSGKSSNDEFVRRGTRGRDDQRFAVRLLAGEKRRGAIEQCGVGAGMNKRARDHRQLYWVGGRCAR